jgi:hypothetical protein
MTEAEWLPTEYQSELLKFVRGEASERKLRLFACAVTRREWRWLIRKRNRSAVEAAERFADGLATQEEMKQAAEGAYDNSRSWALALLREGFRFEDDGGDVCRLDVVTPAGRASRRVTRREVEERGLEAPVAEVRARGC